MIKKMVKKLYLFLLFNFPIFVFTQEYPQELAVDNSYNFIQFYSNEVAKKIQNHFDDVTNEKLVFVHYGGSHIQAEIPTTKARSLFQDKYGNGGRGLIFSYGAANTYSSVNYKSSFKGDWTYVKSFQGRKQIPLGICGMSVDTKSQNAELNFLFKTKLETTNSLLHLFYEKDASAGKFSIWFDSINISLDSIKIEQTSYGIIIPCPNSVNNISIKISCEENQHFTFYGLNIEKNTNNGVIYHSTGVGAAAIRSILVLDKLEEQLPIIKPDFVFLDFGTNDILYTNKIDPKLVNQIESAISKIKSISPEALVILTSTQDLFYKGNVITAGPIFRDLMDSIAQANNCLFWNWYDLAGGLGTIKKWHTLGYAQADGIHLNTKGYQLKGQKIFESFENTLAKIKSTPAISSLHITGKKYNVKELKKNPIEKSQINDSLKINQKNVNSDNEKAIVSEKVIKPVEKKIVEKKIIEKKTVEKSYTVKKGDNLSLIANKFHVSVTALKNKNNLKTDLIRPGQTIKIP